MAFRQVSECHLEALLATWRRSALNRSSGVASLTVEPCTALTLSLAGGRTPKLAAQKVHSMAQMGAERARPILLEAPRC
eukprot:6193887-Pleurochrysis_carterae.AAC.1